MLTHLSVRNFAVLEAAEIDFGPGLTVVTGETGAGKSLLVDALLLLSGARADAGMVRAGAARGELAAEFALDDAPTVGAWLAGQALDEEDGACRVRRVIMAEGGSRAWINGRAASLAQLAELTAPMVEVHGQHEHQALLDRTRQLQLLDAFGDCDDQARRVRDLARRHRELVARERELAGGDNRDARIALLEHEIGELDRWALRPEELADLEARHQRLANAGRLAEGVAELCSLLEGDDEFAATRLLARAQAQLERLANLDPLLKNALELIDNANIQLGEAATTLSHYAQGLDLDPERFAEVDTHLGALHDLSRRHRVPAGELHAHLATLSDELLTLEGAGDELTAIAAERKQCLAEYAAAADTLSQRRRTAAGKLGKSVTHLMDQLGMSGGTFAIELQPRAGDEPDPIGRERSEFMVSANPGMPPRPLRKVASGGELSRIGLAIEVAALGSDTTGTMVFDEVDAGIGGAVAQIVGEKLRALGAGHQVLCVTHLPQVAAQGHAHLSVSKMVTDGTSRTHIATLDTRGRSSELARMLGGKEIDRETRAHAEKMLERVGTRDPGPGTR